MNEYLPPLYYDREGLVLSLEQFVTLYRDRDYRFLARDRVGEWEVVTSWLGIDQSVAGAVPADEDARPQIFSTIAVRSGVGDEVELFEGREHYAGSELDAMVTHGRLLGTVARTQLREARTWAWSEYHRNWSAEWDTTSSDVPAIVVSGRLSVPSWLTAHDEPPTTSWWTVEP
jgi:hypothetical protein